MMMEPLPLKAQEKDPAEFYRPLSEQKWWHLSSCSESLNSYTMLNTVGQTMFLLFCIFFLNTRNQS